MKSERPIKLTRGQTYRNDKSYFYCLRSNGYSADVVNVKSGWRCAVHETVVLPDESIMWAFSVDGRFDEHAKLRGQLAELERMDDAVFDVMSLCHCFAELGEESESRQALQAAAEAIQADENRLRHRLQELAIQMEEAKKQC